MSKLLSLAADFPVVTKAEKDDERKASSDTKPPLLASLKRTKSHSTAALNRSQNVDFLTLGAISRPLVRKGVLKVRSTEISDSANDWTRKALLAASLEV